VGAPGDSGTGSKRPIATSAGTGLIIQRLVIGVKPSLDDKTLQKGRNARKTSATIRSPALCSALRVGSGVAPNGDVTGTSALTWHRYGFLPVILASSAAAQEFVGWWLDATARFRPRRFSFAV
jgi:hypothetical protein